MTRYLLKRIISIIPVLVIVSILIFGLVHITPGDPARTMLGDNASEEEIADLREKLGLNDPLYIQYGRWVIGCFQGDLGDSIFIDEPMTKIIVEHMKPTLSLAFLSIVIALVIAIPLGVIAAKYRGRWQDQVVSGFSMLGISVPSFLLGLLLILLFAVKLGWLPVAGYKSIAKNGFLTHLRYLIMPSISLGIMHAALITRMTRSSILDILYMDYVKMARAKGVREIKIMMKHIIKNAFLPIITIIGQSFIALLGGAVVVENVFNIPGVGQLIVNSVLRRDYAVIQAVVLVVALINVFVTLLIDLIYAVIDPRVKLE